MERPRAIGLEDGGLRLIHGPMDVSLRADGPDAARGRALAAARARFDTLLDELAGELPALRAPVDRETPRCHGPVARRMERAAMAFAGHGFVTPMVAVAGAVAEELLAAMTGAAPDLCRAAANNGGDIALHLAADAVYRIGLADIKERSRLGQVDLTRADGMFGVASSGRHGRSHSLGIADSVTVLAATASMADAAATLIANHVDLPNHPAIDRIPARVLSPDSDLGERPVVTEVGPLGESEIRSALAAGRTFAERLVAEGRIGAAALFLNGRHMVAGCL